MIKPRKPILHWARLVAAKFLKELPISQLYESCFRCDHPFLVHLYPHYLHICIKRNKHNIRVITLNVLCYILYTEKEIFVLCAKLLQSCLDPLCPYGLQPSRLICPWNSSGKNIGVGCCALLQGIFLTQEWDLSLLHLLHWQEDSLPLLHKKLKNNLSEVVEWPVCNYTIANKWTEVWLCFREISLK